MKVFPLKNFAMYLKRLFGGMSILSCGYTDQSHWAFFYFCHCYTGESPVAIPKPIAKPLFLASVAYACSGGTISENSGPVMYDLKQQSGIQITSNSTLSSMVLGEILLYMILSLQQSYLVKSFVLDACMFTIYGREFTCIKILSTF